MNGNAIMTEDIPINRVASIVRSADKSKLYIYVGDSGISGILKSVRNDNDCQRLKIEDKEYEVSPTYKAVESSGKYTLPELSIGGKYQYWLDKEGKIAYIERIDGNLQYAYLINADKSSKVFNTESDIKLRLLLQSDIKVTVETSGKLSIDGNDGLSGADLLADSRLFDSDGNVIRQVVKVTVNANNILKKIEFSDECMSEYGYDNSKFIRNYDESNGKLKYYGSNIKMFDLKYFVADSTVCFARYVNSSESEPYHVISATSLSDKNDYSVSIYDCNEKFEIGAMTVSTSRGGINEALFLVDRAESILSGDDIVYSVTGIYNGKTVTYTEYEPGIITTDLKRGDVIKIGLYNGKISTFNFLYRLSEGKPKPYAASSLGSDDVA